MIGLFFGTGIAVSAAFALLYGLTPGVAGLAPPHWLVAVCALLCLAFGIGAVAARRGAATAAILGCCWATLVSIGAVSLILGQGVRALPLGFLALIVCLGSVLVSGRAGVALALGSAATLVGLAGVESTGTLVRAADETRLAALVTHMLLVLTGLTAGAMVAHSLGRSLRAAGKREQRFRGLLAIATDWYWEQDAQLRFTHVSDTRLGDARDLPLDHLGRARWEIDGLELPPDGWGAHRADLEARQPFRDLVIRRPDVDGGPAYVSVSGEPVFGADGRFRGYWGVGRVVTDEVLAKQALAATEVRYRELFARSPSPLLLHRSGRVVEANDAAVRLLGYADAAAMVGIDLGSHHESGAERERARARSASVDALPPGTALPLTDFRLRRLDGRWVEVQVTSLRVELDDGPAVLSIYSDVTAQRATDRALRHSQTLLTQLFDTTPDTVSLTALESDRVLMLNEQFTRVLGWNSEEAIGRTSTELALWRRPADRERLLQLLEDQGTVQDMPALFGCKSGGTVALNVSAARFELDGVDYLVVVGRDMSAIETARLEREAILQHASIGIAFTRDRRFVHVNATFEAMFGWRNGELVGWPDSVVWPSDEAYAEISRVAGPLLAAGKPFEIERELRRRDGSRFWCRLLARAVDPSDPSRGGTIWVGEDVTQRGAAARALAAARDAAEAANRAKSTFLANTSHEIRTPLNALLGLARLARGAGFDEARRLRYLDQIVDSAQSLAGVISDILDLSKIEAGRLDLETVPFALHDMVRATCRGFEALADASGLTLALHIEADVPPVVRGDPVRVRQILANYVGNALKFTTVGGVRVTLARDANDLLLRVIDTGPGIDPSTQERLFRPFSQADDSTTRRHGGTGLGLSISRELAELMGGEVGVDSAPGRGSSFWARLPLPPAAHAEVGPQDAARLAQVLDGARVLVVEDNAVNMMITVAMLEQWRVVVTQAGDGQQALEAVADADAAGRPFDAVLMDVQMPVMSGHEAARRLRARYEPQQLPIVALTAAALTGEREQALAAGMDGFLTKPIDIEQLQRTLARAIAGRGAVPSALPPLVDN
ncbi:MAG TPA: PAS domain S-box protein [Methylibium sp.]|nr:PAS domain S-box protein [Methylibium sp.]